MLEANKEVVGAHLRIVGGLLSASNHTKGDLRIVQNLLPFGEVFGLKSSLDLLGQSLGIFKPCADFGETRIVRPLGVAQGCGETGPVFVGLDHYQLYPALVARQVLID